MANITNTAAQIAQMRAQTGQTFTGTVARTSTPPAGSGNTNASGSTTPSAGHGGHPNIPSATVQPGSGIPSIPGNTAAAEAMKNAHHYSAPKDEAMIAKDASAELAKIKTGLDRYEFRQYASKDGARRLKMERMSEEEKELRKAQANVNSAKVIADDEFEKAKQLEKEAKETKAHAIQWANNTWLGFARLDQAEDYEKKAVKETHRYNSKLDEAMNEAAKVTGTGAVADSGSLWVKREADANNKVGPWIDENRESVEEGRERALKELERAKQLEQEAKEMKEKAFRDSEAAANAEAALKEAEKHRNAAKENYGDAEFNVMLSTIGSYRDGMDV